MAFIRITAGICLWSLWIAGAGCQPGQTGSGPPQAPEPPAIGKQLSEGMLERVVEIPIPRREHGYNNFDSQVLTSDKAFAAFLETVAGQKHWNHKDEFVAELKSANIDFEASSLLLIRNTAGSGSIRVSLEKPSLESKELVFRIQWYLPGPGTMDMAYYCFAITVPKGIAENVRIVTPMRDDDILPLD